MTDSAKARADKQRHSLSGTETRAADPLTDSALADTMFVWVPSHELEERLAQGWHLCAGWRDAGHHLRYSIPMWRAVTGTGNEKPE